MKPLHFSSSPPRFDYDGGEEDDSERRKLILPGPRKTAGNVHVPANPVPDVDEATMRPRLRLDVPTEPKMERLWRSLDDVVVNWFDCDVSYLQLMFDLNSEFRNPLEPSKGMLRVSIAKEEDKIFLPILAMRAINASFFIKTEFSAKIVSWLKSRHHRSIVRVIVERRVGARERWRRRVFTPHHVAPMPRLA